LSWPASHEDIEATVVRMQARAAREPDPGLQELWTIYQELAPRFEQDLGAGSRDAALAKSGALMVLQAAARARAQASLLVNVDVADLARATAFYCEALGLSIGRHVGDAAIELFGAGAPMYLLAKPAGSAASAATAQRRDYSRHWTPVHLDFAVREIERAVQRARAAGATLEGEIASHPWGRLALMADPFGHGFCLIEFSGRGYDEIVEN
jgi:predicted enzyme related to lactoylglutathione lyase